jgi:putative multiple sugar transport system substrate-binding protein
MEVTAGDPGDNNALYFYNGAMDVLRPYIEAGKLVIKSGQVEFTDVATPTWKTEVAQTRADSILSSFYADGSNIDVWLCSNDSTALGVTNALEDAYDGEWPIITGQDCDISNVKNMIAGKQSMSVFKDTRTLAAQVVKMVGQILAGEEVDVNDTETYDNNVIVVPSYLCEPVFADVNNYEELLLDSGYYTADQLK